MLPGRQSWLREIFVVLQGDNIHLEQHTNSIQGHVGRLDAEDMLIFQTTFLSIENPLLDWHDHKRERVWLCVEADAAFSILYSTWSSRLSCTSNR